jgi:glucose/arabinose dehydrogenase
LALLVGCQSDRPETGEVTLPVASPRLPTPAPVVVPAPTTPPPGSSSLVPVPATIARGVNLATAASGFERPVLLVVAPGDSRRRLFVVEQRGKIRIVENGVTAKRPFFDSDKRLSTGGEQGLLGLAFHPQFQANGRLYVDYTTEDKNTHIVEYRVSASDPDRVDMTTAKELIEIRHPFSNHNGGNLLFGPDGKLYTGTGDGGSANDPFKNGQNRQALLAKILRFDVDAAKPVPELVHLGSRNPWRFWFDKPTGDLYIGDVGQNLWENVYVVAGDDHSEHNFGWNIVEGNHCFMSDTCDRSGLTPPVADYGHDQGCSVTGGVTYRGKALPALTGRYFYADYCTGLLRSFRWTRDPSSPTARGWIRDHWDWKPTIDHDGVLAQISSFGVDADGEIYIVLLTGSILELVPSE